VNRHRRINRDAWLFLEAFNPTHRERTL
jgi:hypothetical protein